MKTATLFDAPKLSVTIVRNGAGWLARNRAMVESWGADQQIDHDSLRAAIDADLQHCRDVRLQAPNRDRFAGQCVAITSLSPNPQRQARQLLCIKSWRDIGLPVIAVNTAKEIESIDVAAMDIVAVVSDELSIAYDRPTQKISKLARIGAETGLPFFLVNADIEMSGDPDVITQALQAKDSLTIGVRHNHRSGQSHDTAIRERWGLDLFGMTPKMVSSLPDLPLAIGKPVWDYWLPLHFRNLGHRFHWIREPFLFHELHQLAWNQSEWMAGAEILRTEYGVSLQHDSAAFRRSLDTKTSMK